MDNLQTVPGSNAASNYPAESVQSESETQPSGATSLGQTPLTPDERIEIMAYLQARVGLNQEQANQFVEEAMQPDEVRQFLSITSGQQPLTPEMMRNQWNLNDEEIEFVLQGQESLSMEDGAANRSNHFGGVFVTSHPFGNIFVEFMALMYSLGTDVKKMMSTVAQQRKELAMNAADEQFKGAIATFSASMVAGVVSVGLAGANLFKTKAKPAAEATAGAGNPAKAGQEPAKPGSTGSNDDAAASAAARENKKSLLNDALNNTWTSPNAIALLNQPITAGGQFIDAYYQRNAAQNQAESQEAEAIFQQLMNHLQQTQEASQAAAQGAA